MQNQTSVLLSCLWTCIELDVDYTSSYCSMDFKSRGLTEATFPTVEKMMNFAVDFKAFDFGQNMLTHKTKLRCSKVKVRPGMCADLTWNIPDIYVMSQR